MMLPQYGWVRLASEGSVLKRYSSVPPATPMTITAPPLATTWVSSASVESLPTQSSTSAAPRPPGELTDLGRGVVAGVDRVIRADLERERELGGVDIRGDHPGGVSARRICTAM